MLREKRRKHRLHHVTRSRVVERTILVAAAEGESRAIGDIRAKQEEARTEAWRWAVGIMHDVQRAIFRATWGGDARSVIGASEKTVFPLVPLTAEKRGGAAALGPRQFPFASLADIAKGGDGATSALREIFLSLLSRGNGGRHFLFFVNRRGFHRLGRAVQRRASK